MVACGGVLRSCSDFGGVVVVREEETIAAAALIGATRLEQSLLALATEDAAGAAAGLTESLTLLQSSGHGPLIARSLDGLAHAAHARSDAARAAGLLGAADGLRAAAGVVLAPADRAAVERIAATVRSAIGAGHYNAAWAVGHQAPPEEVIACALAVAVSPGAGTPA